MTAAESKAPKVKKSDVTRLTYVLRQCGVWLNAADFENVTPRELRAIANASCGEIISGQQGYKLTSEATREEIEHCCARLRHQAQEMNKRASEIETTAKLNRSI